MAAAHPLAIDPGDIFHQRQQRDMMRSGRNGTVLVGKQEGMCFQGFSDVWYTSKPVAVGNKLMNGH